MTHNTCRRSSNTQVRAYLRTLLTHSTKNTTGKHTSEALSILCGPSSAMRCAAASACSVKRSAAGTILGATSLAADTAASPARSANCFVLVAACQQHVKSK